MESQSITSLCRGALYGMYIGDALAMPVHWYYDRNSLARDYGTVTDYLSPKNPHPDSELWKHHYKPMGPKDNILHDQARYWGTREIHYHQFLEAGENTLNVKLCNLLIGSLIENGRYDTDDYLMRLIDFMTTPGNHRDTYIDEYLRGFFKNYVSGKPVRLCGIPEKHLSGLFGALPIAVYYRNSPETARAKALEHVFLTHTGTLMEEAAMVFLILLQELFAGRDAKEVLADLLYSRKSFLLPHSFSDWLDQADADVVDRHLGTGCYVDEALPVVIYLFLKYHRRPEAGLIANTNLGGNNAARGSVLGALLGAANGIEAFPERWVRGLRHPPAALPGKSS